MSTDMDRLSFERDLETPAGEGSMSPVPAGPGAPTAADAPDRTPAEDGSTALSSAGERGAVLWGGPCGICVGTRRKGAVRRSAWS
ncbi:hypothetical protein ACN24K_31000 [Streptomyces microflavus]